MNFSFVKTVVVLKKRNPKPTSAAAQQKQLERQKIAGSGDVATVKKCNYADFSLVFLALVVCSNVVSFCSAFFLSFCGLLSVSVQYSQLIFLFFVFVVVFVASVASFFVCARSVCCLFFNFSQYKNR